MRDAHAATGGNRCRVTFQLTFLETNVGELADIVRLSASPGEKITVHSATRVRFPTLSPKTTAYRLVLTVELGGQKVRAYVDAVILQHGRIQSGILFTSLGGPLDQTQRVAIASVVAERMAKATRRSGPIA